MSPAIVFGAGDAGAFAARVLAQSFAVLLPTWLLLRLAGRNRPAARYTVALCGLLSALTSPAIAASVSHAGTGPLPAASASAGRAASEQSLAAPSSGASLPGASNQDAAPGTEREIELLILLVWAGGTTAALAGLLRRWRMTASLCCDAQPFPADRLARLLPEIRAVVGDRRALPPVLLSPRVGRPVALGVLRPVVLVPVYCAEELTDRELRDVLVHEFAHVIQAHLPLGFGRAVIQALFWPNPLVHVVGRELSRACEELSDNVVLRCTEAPGYARTLLRVAELKTDREEERLAPASSDGAPDLRPGRNWRWPAWPGRRWKLIDRVDGLLDAARERSTRPHFGKFAATAMLLLAPGVSMAGIRTAARTPARPMVSRIHATRRESGGLAPRRADFRAATEGKR